MPKRRVLDLVDGHHRIPRRTYQKIVAVKDTLDNPTGRSSSINQALCLCLDEYFQMKEAQEDAKQPILKG
jgi:hypothetical protein